MLQESRQLATVFRARPDLEWGTKLKAACKRLPNKLRTQLTKDNDIYYKGKQLFVPIELREGLIRQIHKAPAYRHQGITATIKRIRRHYYFPKIKEEI